MGWLALFALPALWTTLAPAPLAWLIAAKIMYTWARWSMRRISRISGPANSARTTSGTSSSSAAARVIL